MARATMETLIGRVRGHINDPAGDDQTFTDDEIEAVLDVYRLELRQSELLTCATQTSTGPQYLIFTSEQSDLEDGATLQDADYATVTADVVDVVAGRWEFTAQPNYPLYVTGWAYDHYGAAAELMERKIAQVAEDVDWAADGGSYKDSQLYGQLNGVAGFLRQMAKGYGFHFNKTIDMIRTDVPEYEG